MKVKAKEMGLYKDQRRRPGVIFALDDPAHLQSWMEVVQQEQPAAEAIELLRQDVPAGAPKTPTTLSEMTPKPKKRGRPPQTFREIADEGV